MLFRRVCRTILLAFALQAVCFAPGTTRPAPDSFADLADKLLPTVVSIATSQTLKQAGPQAALPNVPPGSPLADLFKNFLGPQREAPRHITSLGAGFVVDPSGYIVTNNHVIEDAEHITATFNDGETLPAKLIGRDEKTDLALLKVSPKKPLAAARFGDSDKARIGDWVIAIGNPFGLGSTVTAGIVSARNRDINAGPYDEFIQTDAPINRGNSGGPLFDMNGDVIGVNSAIYSPSGGSVGIGFSIPSNLVREVIAQLKAHGVLRRGWIGVRIQAVTSDIAQGLGLSSATGALVTNVTPKGPAARAGLANGDLILAFDGKAVSDSRALPRIVADTPIGKTVPVDVVRNGKKQTMRLTVAKLEDETPLRAQPQKKSSAPAAPAKSRISQLGLSLAPIDGDARAQFKLARDVQGVVVTDVAPDSPAAEKNLRPGDVIVKVQGQNVRTPGDVMRRIDSDAKAGRKIELLLVSRGGDLAYVALKLG
ncbi:MAG TPA: DegQ family serine endoprotease [Rhizomicrobium sp.]|nr:DegQ family serine endoprotease [Rhizomicrobium sp.]